MSRSKAMILGVFTCWPVFYMLAFLMIMLLFLATKMITPGAPEALPVRFKTLFLLHFLTIIEIFILLIIYIRFLFKTDRVPKGKKALWAVVLFLGNIVSMPIFWYLYIWRNMEHPEGK